MSLNIIWEEEKMFLSYKPGQRSRNQLIEWDCGFCFGTSTVWYTVECRSHFQNTWHENVSNNKPKITLMWHQLRFTFNMSSKCIDQKEVLEGLKKKTQLIQVSTKQGLTVLSETTTLKC